MYVDKYSSSTNGNSDGLREKFAIAVQAINTFVPATPGSVFPWTAELAGTRLTIRPSTSDDNFVSGAFLVGTDPTLVGNSINNVQLYQLGTGGTKGNQTPGTTGSDGLAPAAADYDAAYLVIDKEVDLFNLMVLPPDASVSMKQIYPNASAFCAQRRAFLLMDPPTTWDSVQTAAADVANQRIGLKKDYSAIFFPRITVDAGGKSVNIGPSGAVAGLCARIDGTRGVWKAPAGTEADLLGVLGLEYRLSDPENGVTNPRAINTIRIFPEGIIVWGSRTNDGDDNFGSEYKYIPIRRLALYIEESLYRGLKWVVFEPNDEPLWSQIRLNVGSFMHDLFRNGAFQGQTPKDAYFVKCDGETTTQSDRNLGIVNIWVGFAPLKPAEFVILYLQQMAGQIQV
jgi:phage tail sheath protein FI